MERRLACHNAAGKNAGLLVYPRENRLAAAGEKEVLAWFLRCNLSHTLVRI
jgi:hypothetical protein